MARLCARRKRGTSGKSSLLSRCWRARVHVGDERVADAVDDDRAAASVCKLAAVGVQRDVRGLAAGGQGRGGVNALERHCGEFQSQGKKGL